MGARSHATNKSLFTENNELISIIDEYKQIVNSIAARTETLDIPRGLTDGHGGPKVPMHGQR